VAVDDVDAGSVDQLTGEPPPVPGDLVAPVLAPVQNGPHDAERLEWALRMLPVSRSLERTADHAVDIAEQAWFLTTGELRELD
jgi:PhoU domain